MFQTPAKSKDTDAGTSVIRNVTSIDLPGSVNMLKEMSGAFIQNTHQIDQVEFVSKKSKMIAETATSTVHAHEAAQIDVHPEAERALLRVREKLNGIEMGNTLSPLGQARYLIHEASNPVLLSQMYYGWQPWM